MDVLRLDLQDVLVSEIRETQPVGVGGEHKPFLNAVAVGSTRLSPRALLDRLLEIEEERGRMRPYPMAPRTLDLDLILYGDQIVTLEGLSIPHPRFREREFVLAPLAEIAPELVDPVTGQTARELFTKLYDTLRSS